MATGTTESPATLYAPVSLGLGVIALIATFFLGIFAVLAGALAITFGVLGLISKVEVNRVQCYIGLAAGVVGVVLPVSFLFVYTGGF
ncbi:hypothetical protein AMK21_19180 [Streptomyces sp. CB00316]|uniref:hypothetical protein n=1 Tax=unclassified Streptomyces TaxID=2593676 RepID=UPI00093DF3D6|nr:MULTISPECIES: hypothetical protein [unclassified Streptomyces]MBT2379542.1 hypothetical protein [Streptomyces sp. ISL-111]MBT2428550.1 hypothetical protein [Streptomyces sp. ISL-112]MBT2465163.1 hypothetical protein [Streptomyces sp. ISL-63]OKJ19222.1 hypothetical protein AMK21_19180 [Streptomyces sp. CB00316]